MPITSSTEYPQLPDGLSTTEVLLLDILKNDGGVVTGESLFNAKLITSKIYRPCQKNGLLNAVTDIAELQNFSPRELQSVGQITQLDALKLHDIIQTRLSVTRFFLPVQTTTPEENSEEHS